MIFMDKKDEASISIMKIIGISLIIILVFGVFGFTKLKGGDSDDQAAKHQQEKVTITDAISLSIGNFEIPKL